MKGTNFILSGPGIIIVVLAVLAGASSAQAHIPTCAHPSYHRGEVLPLELVTSVADNEWYVIPVNAPVGCHYVLVETINGVMQPWRFDYARLSGQGINPSVGPGETACYLVAQMDDGELPPGEWRWSNEACVTGEPGEREGGV